MTTSYCSYVKLYYVALLATQVGLAIDFELASFTGMEVTISIECLEATSVVVLHAAGNLDLSATTVSLMKGEAMPYSDEQYAAVTELTRDEEHETLSVWLNRSLETGGKYSLWFFWIESDLMEDSMGFRRSSYKVGAETR